jgi:hypothetical protein
MRSRELVLTAALLASATGCLRNLDPSPRSMATVQADAHGTFAIVSVTGQDAHVGELIAIGPSEVWILSGDELIQTPLQFVSELEVYPYEISTAGIAGWGVLGTLSTISHGFWLVFSAPVWILTSTITGVAHSRTARERYIPGNWQALAKWARFPQGLPYGLTATELLHGRPSPAVPAPPPSAPLLLPPSLAPSTPPPSPLPPS